MSDSTVIVTVDTTSVEDAAVLIEDLTVAARQLERQLVLIDRRVVRLRDRYAELSKDVEVT